MRTAQIERNTKETQIKLNLNLDGTGVSNIATGVGFLDHMLTLFASHGRFDLDVTCNGDTDVDDHHSVEDIGIALGMAFRDALGEKRGIERYSFFILPMDEALIRVAVDFSGRDFLSYKVDIPASKVGTFDTELGEEFWMAFVRNAGCTLHIRQLEGTNSHHILEGIFKAAGHTLKGAVRINPEFADEVPSTKGVL